LKKKYDPLWEIVGENVGLQGEGSRQCVSCPHCRVSIEVPICLAVGEQLRCGLCGGLSELSAGPGDEDLVARPSVGPR
jgi:hypothetical protein